MEIGRLSSAPDKTAMLRRLGRGRWKISQNRIINRKFRLRDDRWRGLLSIYINFKVVVHSEENLWTLVSPTEFPSVIACKVSTFGSLYTRAFRPWHHNSVPAHIRLHSGLFKLTLIHRCTVRPGTLIWKSGNSFRRLSRLHWHCNSIQFRESLVLSKDRIEFHQTFRNQAAIKQCPKQTVRHIHTRERSERENKRSNTRKWFYKHYLKQVTNETYGIVVLAL